MRLISKKFHLIVAVASLLLVGFLAGLAGNKFLAKNSDTSCDKTKYPYLNQAIICNPPPVIDKQDYISFKANIEEFIQAKKKGGNLSEIAVYFRDLQNGPIMGINEGLHFVPASLLKVPLLLTYLSLEEKFPGTLDKKISFSKKIDVEIAVQRFAPKEKIKENEPYSLKELLEHLIIYSDNNAYGALSAHLKKISPHEDLPRRTLLDLGIVDPQVTDDQIITVKSYASIFRALFNSSYFEKKETSEYALSLLSKVDFQLGLAAGIPGNIAIAHKFGERSDIRGQQKQLHDCGIIYYPDNPYLLCIMTRGYDFSKLAEIIGHISEMAYKEVNSRRLR